MTEVFAPRIAATAAKRRPQQAGDILTGSQYLKGRHHPTGTAISNRLAREGIVDTF